eukprot:scaffold33345_cov123-Isochrysis_galbana.AAC.9
MSAARLGPAAQIAASGARLRHTPITCVPSSDATRIRRIAWANDNAPPLIQQHQARAGQETEFECSTDEMEPSAERNNHEDRHARCHRRMQRRPRRCRIHQEGECARILLRATLQNRGGRMTT